MPTCIVCLSDLKDPAALPCGHVFCWDCVIRLIRSSKPFSSHHFCPTCKQPYTISNVDPNLVPLHLRSFITPSVRKLQLEYTIPVPNKDGTMSNAEYEKLLAENASLKTCSFVWRKRAAVHAAATLGLVGLARMARDYALRLKKERDEFEARYNEMKKLYEEKTASPETPPETPPSPRNPELRASSSPATHLPHITELGLEPLEAHLPPSLARAPSPPSSASASSPSRSPSPRSLSRSPSHPLYRLPSPALSDSSYCSECPDCADRKRKRSADPEDDEEDAAEERPIKRSHSTSPAIASPAPAPAVFASPGRNSVARYLEGTLSI